MRLVFALLAAALLVPAPARGQSAVLQIDRDSLRVGEAFDLVLVVNGGGVVLPPDSTAFDPEISVAMPPDQSTNLNEQGRETTRLTYRAQAFALDSLVVRPVAVRVVNRVDTLVLSTTTATVRMQRLVPNDSTAKLKPARPPLPFGPPLGLLFAIVLAALAAFAYWAWKRRGAPPPPVVAEPERVLTPLETLLRDLDALDRVPQPDGRDVRPFFDSLTEAFRTYLEARLNIPAHEQTSRELVEHLDRMERAGTLQSGATALARDLFRVADLARFADVRPDAQVARVAVDQTRTLGRYLEASREVRIVRGGVPKLAASRPVPTDA